MLYISLYSIFYLLNFILCADTIPITVIHSTDIHGWIQAHRHEESYTATIGDLYNFVHHRKSKASPDELVLFFDTGDLVQGTGLSDATDIPGQFIFEQAKRLPYDALCIGNHELGPEEIPPYMATNFIPHWNGNFVVANVKLSDDSKKFADPYTFIDLPNGQGKILVFGFLYTMLNAAKVAKVDNVTEVLQSGLFDELGDDKDIKLVIGLLHISTDSDEVVAIYEHFRGLFPNLPILLLTGHSHLTRQKVFEDESSSFSVLRNSDEPTEKTIYTGNGLAVESGCYMRTVGVINFNLSLSDSLQRIDFNRTFLTANKEKLQAFINVSPDDWETEVSRQIEEDCKAEFDRLKLSNVIGDIPETYKKKQGYNETDSVFALVANKLMPAYATDYRDVPPENPVTTLFAVSYSSVRNPIYQGPFIEDDLYSVDPFNNPLATITDVKGSDVEILKQSTIVSDLAPSSTHRLSQNDDGKPFTSKYYLTQETIQPDSLYDICTTSYDVNRILTALNANTGGHYVYVNSTISFRVMLNGSITKTWPPHSPPSSPPSDPPTKSKFPTVLVVSASAGSLVVIVIIVVVVAIICFHRARRSGYEDFKMESGESEKEPYPEPPRRKRSESVHFQAE